MKCWAREISPCQGPQSGEHYVSKALIEASAVKIRGLPFCGDELIDVPLSGLKANILCKHHNECLSELDSEVKRFRDAIFAINSGPSSTKRTRVSGARLSRWVAKTYCNFMAVGKRPTEPCFAQYAFAESVAKPLHFYVWFPLARDAARLRVRTQLTDDHFQFNHFHDQCAITVFIRLCGLKLFLTNFDARATAVLECGTRLSVDTRDLVENPTRFGLSRGLPDGGLARSHDVFIDW